MSEAYVDLSLIPKIKKLCVSAENEMRSTITLLNKVMNSISAGWKDQKAKEFEGIVNQCITSLKNPLNDLHRCDSYLQRLVQALKEYEDIKFSNIGSNDSVSESNTNGTTPVSLNLNDCNEALSRDGRGMQMVDISCIQVDGVSDSHFWSHHGRSESEWQAGMSEYTNMMQSFSNGMSIEQCYETYPATAGMVFGAQPVQLSDDGNGGLAITNGRHRVAMAQRLGITHLPAIVY